MAQEKTPLRVDLTSYDKFSDFTSLYQFDQKLEQLKSNALAENWDYRDITPTEPVRPNLILRNYIFHTFGRLLDEHGAAGIYLD